MTELADRTVWITGASSGIGEALARAASPRGARLILSARRDAELARVRDACDHPERVAVVPLDLEQTSAEEAHRRAAEPFGPIDVLVNNAGVTQRSVVADTSMDVYRRLMELDFFVPVALAKAVLPGMIERRRGHLVAISSVAGKIGTPMRSGYCAAKHALVAFHDALRAEVWRSDVRVTVILPGYIRTPISLHALTGGGTAHGVMDPGQARGLDPAVCAERIWRAVERDRTEVAIGGREIQALWLKRFVPKVVERVLRTAKVT